jgi:hypothetical protein
MLKHFLSSHIRRIAGDIVAMVPYSIGHVIILTTPTPEHVAEPIYLQKLSFCQDCHTTKKTFIWESVNKKKHLCYKTDQSTTDLITYATKN